MNDLDLAITATLRAEAQEAGMSTNTPQQYEELVSRLDDVDRSRTRTRWLMAAAAVVLVGGAAWAVTNGGQTSSAPPAATSTPTPVEPTGQAALQGMTYYAADMDPDVRLTLPGWTSSTTIDWSSPRGAYMIQEQCGEPIGAPACTADDDVKLRLETLVAFYPASGGAIVKDPSYGEVLAHLDELQSSGFVAVSDRSATTVGGRPATVMNVAVAVDAPGVLGCPTPTSKRAECYPLVAGRDVRIAVVDQGATTPPTLFYLSLNKDAADMAERFAELDAMLSTVEFS